MYRDTICEDEPTTAPRVGCRCRTCCRTRERAVDPRLAALAYQPGMTMQMQFSAATIHRQIQRYIIGDIALEALPIEIIKTLAEVIGKQQEQLTRLIERQPFTQPMFAPAKAEPPTAILPGNGIAYSERADLIARGKAVEAEDGSLILVLGGKPPKIAEPPLKPKSD